MRALLIVLLLLTSLPSLGQKAPETEPDLVKMMHEAAAGGDVGGIEFFLSKGVDVDARDRRGYTPMMSLLYGDGCRKVAAWNLVVDGIEVLAEAGADLNVDDGRPFRMAAGCQPIWVIDALLEAGAELDPRGGGSLMRHQDERTLRHLIELGVDINGDYGNGTALIAAAIFNDAETVERLLALGADPAMRDSKGKRAVDHAAELGRPDIVSILHGADDVDPHLASPLLLEAAKAGDLENVKRLLAAGADPNYRDRREMSPLYAAIESNSIEIARLLLGSGADPASPANYGMKPLMQATTLADTTILTVLLERSDFSKTELSDALLFATTGEAVALLLKRGADPNHVGSLEYQGNHVASQVMDGSTPLIRAASVNCLDCIDLLIAAGADPAYVGPGIETALMSAGTAAAIERIESLLAAEDVSEAGVIIGAVVKEILGSKSTNLPAISFSPEQQVPANLRLHLPRGMMIDRRGNAHYRIEILEVSWIRSDLVLVSYDYVGHGWGGWGGVYALKKGAEGWVVVDSSSTWVS